MDPEAKMAIDGCRHSFEGLVDKVLPGHLKHLRRAMRFPWRAVNLAKPNIGPKTFAKSVGLEDDLSGCYVFMRGVRPIYVGISRSVLARIRQHLRGRGHLDASLAYAMAQDRQPTPGSRSDAMKNRRFLRAFDAARRGLSQMNVAAVVIENPLELHVFEAYAAMKLKTSKWNTFRTH
jgi:hypothetical protein